jgi:putative glutamine amidotransferase
MTPKPRIAIPVPHSQKPEYAQRSLPQYIHAIEDAGGEAVVIQLTQASEQIAKQITDCQAALLPGSAADVDPQKYGAARLPQTAEADPLRDAVDELLLQDAHNLRKPIFGICYGLQSLNV